MTETRTTPARGTEERHRLPVRTLVAASVGNAVEEKDLGIASAAQQVMTQVGVVAGIQLMVTIQASRQADRGLIGSFHDAYLLGAGVAFLGVVCACFLRSYQRDEVTTSAPS